MDIGFEQMVRERAYAIWMAAGQTDGMADAHWTSAEEMVKSELAPAQAAKPAKAAVTTASAKKPASAKAKTTPAKTKTAVAVKAKVSAKRMRPAAVLAN